MDLNSRIRNFAIIAHIDHGKSTLADRLIEFCGGLDAREMKSQVLDSMDLEKEKGITIKAQMVRLYYDAKDGCKYQLNLIDTPGHVDFSYEVSRALSAVEGSLLVVDASQGVEAQTLANVYKAMENNNEIIPIINKIDLEAAEPEKVAKEIEDVIGIDTSNKVLISAKSGIGTQDVLEAIIKYIPAPKGLEDDKLAALLIDSWYDLYLGVVILIRVFDGVIKKGMKVRMMATNSTHIIENVGYFTPKKQTCTELKAGEIGFITATIKQVADCKIGDTIIDDRNPREEALPGFKANLPVVFCGLYPEDASQFEHLKDSLAKLKLNDSSFEFEPESSTALGMGFRCGFLGLLHLEIIQERLIREYDIEMTTTAPSVVYNVHLNNGDILKIHNPCDLPEPQYINFIEEPWMKATIFVPDQYLGPVLALCTEKRGIQNELSYVSGRAMVIYQLPLNEVVFDFYDKLKSC